MMTRKRRNKMMKLAKGYWGSKSKHFKMAKQAVKKSAFIPMSEEKTRRGTSAASGSPYQRGRENERMNLFHPYERADEVRTGYQPQIT
jgi:hypothetical protein